MENSLVRGLSEESTKIQTENGMETYSSSLNNCLDLFFVIGALRSETNIDRIIGLFSRAWNENKLLALLILFWARDIRGGAGERRVFRIITKWLVTNYKSDFERMIPIIPHYGRWDDIFELDSDVVPLTILNGLTVKDSLLAKWLPRKGKFANKIRKYLKVNPKQYRRLLVDLTKVVETQMCNKEWDKIEYSKVPSQAFKNYQKAFSRHDSDRFGEFIERALKGEEKINASAIHPHEILKPILQSFYTAMWYEGNTDVLLIDEDLEKSVNAQWMNLPDYIGDSKESFLPVCDVSGSMEGIPMEVCVALGIYLSERNNSAFKDCFITFSKAPRLQKLSGRVSERVRQLYTAEWDGNTDIEAVFKLILDTAIKNNVPATDMPSKILIMSDMEFDRCVRNSHDTAMDMIKRMYEEAGYTVPQIVFWNIDSRQNNIPVRYNEKGVALVSGFSPSIMQSLLGGDLDPIKIMLKTVGGERYQLVKETFWKIAYDNNPELREVARALANPVKRMLEREQHPNNPFRVEKL